MRIRSWVLALLAVMPVVVFNSCSTANNGTTSGTGFMWVATKGDQLVSSFTIDLSNGAVSSVRSSVSTGPNPSAMALTPDGKTLFVASVDDNCGTAQTPVIAIECDHFQSTRATGPLGPRERRSRLRRQHPARHLEWRSDWRSIRQGHFCSLPIREIRERSGRWGRLKEQFPCS